MPRIGAYEAKTKLATLLERVAEGEHITITKHGMPVAMLSPVPERERRPAAEVIADLLGFRRGRCLGRPPLRELIEEGRRLTAADSARFIELLMSLPIVADGRSHERALSQVLAVARQVGASVYDASYLELAMRFGATLATRDAQLKAAAATAGVPLFDLK